MKSVAIRSSQQAESNAGAIRAEISVGPGGSTSGTSQVIPAIIGSADPAAGSTVNEYKTSLQLPGSHLGIHLAATHLLVIKHCLMYLESMKLSGVPEPVWPQGSSVMFCLFLCCNPKLRKQFGNSTTDMCMTVAITTEPPSCHTSDP